MATSADTHSAGAYSISIRKNASRSTACCSFARIGRLGSLKTVMSDSVKKRSTLSGISNRVAFLPTPRTSFDDTDVAVFAKMASARCTRSSSMKHDVASTLVIAVASSDEMLRTLLSIVAMLFFIPMRHVSILSCASPSAR